MTELFDAEKWLRIHAGKIGQIFGKELNQCADELAAAKYKAEHYEYMYRELNIHANKHAASMQDKLTAEQAISRKLYEDIRTASISIKVGTPEYDLEDTLEILEEAIAEYEGRK
jgi:hypothetical protein